MSLETSGVGPRTRRLHFLPRRLVRGSVFAVGYYQVAISAQGTAVAARVFGIAEPKGNAAQGEERVRVRLSKKLLDVASNFFEIEREGKNGEKTPGSEGASEGTAYPSPDGDAATHELDGYLQTNTVEAQPGDVETDEDTVVNLDDFATAILEAPAPEAVEDIADIEMDLDISSAVSEEGVVDFKRIFRHAGLPVTRFTAEQALSMLEGLPDNLPITMKRKAVKATLDALGEPMGAVPDEIRADAERKRDGIKNYIDTLTSRTEQVCQDVDTEIARLEAAIIEQRARRERAESLQVFAWDACRRQIGLMDEVAFFFQDNLNEVEQPKPAPVPVAEEEEQEEGELPPYLANDTAYRLLGITGEAPTLQKIAEDNNLDIDVAAIESMETSDRSVTKIRKRRRNGANDEREDAEEEAGTPVGSAASEQ